MVGLDGEYFIICVSRSTRSCAHFVRYALLRFIFEDSSTEMDLHPVLELFLESSWLIAIGLCMPCCIALH